ncbi:MAG: phosphoribosyltransferase family protein [bacterium]
MINLFSKILNWIYPKKCLTCKKFIEHDFLCDECLKKINYNSPKPIKIVLDIKVYSACLYIRPINNLIKALKYKGKTKTTKLIAQILYEYLQKTELNLENTELIPVPLHKKRQKHRSFNHMELIAKELSILTSCPINNKLVKRIKNTKPQHELSTEQRSENLKNAFKVEKKNYNGKTIIILDDIFTSGATVSEIIKELKNQEIDNIITVVLSNPKK